jgi:hypothetical protein
VPRPDQTPPIDFRGLPYGAEGAIDEAAEDMELFGEPDEEPDEGGPDEEFLFGGTDRPMEPLTAGAPFGPGMDATRFAFESDQDILDGLAARVSANPQADSQAKAWAATRAKGL